MSFNDIEPLRKALQGVPEGIIKPAMASLLWVIVSFPNGCYIGQEALAKQACLKHDNFTKTLRSLTKLGLVDRDQTHARTGVRQCYRVNMPKLLELGRVELSTPSPDSSMEQSPVKGGTESVSGCSPVDPYKYNKYNKSFKEDLFKSTLSFIPTFSQFAIDEPIRKTLKELELRGTTLEAVKDDFRQVNWNAIDNPKAFVSSRLRDLRARPVVFSATNRPPKCSNPECDEETRQLPYFQEVPGGDGQRSQKCYECNWYWVNRKNGLSSDRR